MPARVLRSRRFRSPLSRAVLMALLAGVLGACAPAAMRGEAQQAARPGGASRTTAVAAATAVVREAPPGLAACCASPLMAAGAQAPSTPASKAMSTALDNGERNRLERRTRAGISTCYARVLT